MTLIMSFLLLLLLLNKTRDQMDSRVIREQWDHQETREKPEPLDLRVPMGQKDQRSGVFFRTFKLCL